VLLNGQLEEAGLGPLATSLATENPDNVKDDAEGLLGYTVHPIARTSPHTIRIVFTALNGADEVTLEAPAGEGSLQPFPLEETNPRIHLEYPVFGPANKLFASARSRMAYSPARSRQMQARQHRYWSKSLAVCCAVGYVREVVHVNKEFRGRELLSMRRVPHLVYKNRSILRLYP